MKTLLELEKNKAAIIKEVAVKDTTKRRLLDLGLTKGSKVIVKGKAPLGDPILVNLRGIDLALRKADAAKIIIEA